MYLIVINPTSGNGKPMGIKKSIEDILQQRGIDYRIAETTIDLHAYDITREACASEYEGIIVAGGDGTFFDAVNGMSRSDIPMLFVSCGTGNDFVRVLNLPKDPLEALKAQLDSPIGHIDVGRMNEYRFLNVSGTGFDVDVLRNTEAFKGRYSGLSAYMHGLLEAYKTYKPLEAMVSFDGEKEERVFFSVLSVGNGRYFGGGMKAVPDARIDDGLFDVITVAPVKKFILLPLLVFFITGKHVKIGLGKLRRCRKLSIRCTDMTINMDGELRNTDHAEYEILENALAVRLP